MRHEDAWRLLTSSRGRSIWLGSTPDMENTKGTTYRLSDGTTGEMRVFTPNSHLRITWFPKGWPRASTIQVRVVPKGERCVIVFHQEHLPGPEERELRRAHFKASLDELEQIIRSEGQSAEDLRLT
jgi:uncharacterized protein YndB with AHSA1/START domain